MEPGRPLRDVFADLADQATGHEDAGSSAPDPRSFLAEYADLPDELLVTAIGSYADTAPAEVAEHLARFVATPGADATTGLNLLASAPAGAWEGEVDLPNPDGREGADADGDDEPGLHLGDLGSADSLDLDETTRFQDDDPAGGRTALTEATEHEVTEDEAADGGGVIDDEVTGLMPDPIGSEQHLPGPDHREGPGSVVPAEIHHDVPVDDPDGHYLDEHQDIHQPTELGELDELAAFDDFDA